MRVPAGPLLGIGQRTVHSNLKDSPRRGNQLDSCVAELLFYLRRQTGGAALVVSNNAVLDGDMHRSSGLSDLYQPSNQPNGQREPN